MFLRSLSVAGLFLGAAAALGQTPGTPPGEPAPVAPPVAAAETPATIPQTERDLIHLEVLLDRAHFSPGVIDGKDGGNLRLAVAAYRKANHATGDDQKLLGVLAAADPADPLQHYTITDADVAGPFLAKLPTTFAELAKLDSPAYTSATEELAERFHMGEALLWDLNPGVNFGKAGTVITVAAVDAGKLPRAVTRIMVDKSHDAVRAFDAKGQLLAAYPATVGSTERPAPTGTWKVRTVALEATYTFDPKRLTFGKKGSGKLTIKAGPNNPVGTTWIDLTKDTYGIHGTPDPQLIGKRASHGCVRLTNWDAHQLALSVKAGATVVFSGRARA
ncbi:MAG: L,D-transpeptidase family protein [Janthinobacterium lividum]